mmetsp:Transcript_18750/g.26362  ORF Transcript_18750/g.26362 Transcript_18750/m.26362 type:complete len:82 (+) Transcript_18750:149-394(+)
MGQKTCRMATGVHIGMPYAYHLRTSVENAYLPIRSLPVYGGSCSSLILKLITANASADQPGWQRLKHRKSTKGEPGTLAWL